MTKRSWLYLFLVVLTVNITGILLLNGSLQFISKPIIIVSLAIYFINATKENNNELKKWILSALLFSWLGDILLMFQSGGSGEFFFLLGLCAFLVAHIFYIIFFHRVRIRESVKGRWWLLLIVGVYYAVLITMLSPYLTDLKLPVRFYGIIISFMLLLALHMFFIRNRNAGWLMAGGAFLFVISDSILAINKFYFSFEFAGLAVMLTYGLAQLFIVEGAIQYIRNQ